MRKFDYFLFENFDADETAQHPANPRSFLNAKVDSILEFAAQGEKLSSSKLLDHLKESGVLRSNGKRFFFDCPIFLKEDVAVLARELPLRIEPVIDSLSASLSDIYAACRNIQNGFSVQINLYHILCGMVFDGAFFDFLSEKKALATSRIHPSGLDYLVVIYEKCEELANFSNSLLCSYNRFCNQHCSLQSFGDSLGNRSDFYRFFRLMEQNNLPASHEPLRTLVQTAALNKDFILAETAEWLHGKPCSSSVMRLLEAFGYAINNKSAVPVFKPEHRPIIAQIERIIEEKLGNAIEENLYELSGTINITAVRHGVNRLEIANELYHLIFGCINEELVHRGIVACPPLVPTEGRYLRCIELYDE